jgi:endonuclease/exonuclease/phosphatase family metal-dependent hydrolase
MVQYNNIHNGHKQEFDSKGSWLMKYTRIISIFLISFGLLIYLTCTGFPGKAPLRIMSFNIRYNNTEDGENAWPNRKELVVSMIRSYKVDIVGLQEALKDQIDFLIHELTEFAWFGVGRDDGKEMGEYTAVLFRRDRLQLVDSATFWLSESPEAPGLGWDAVCNRTVTWGFFLDKHAGTSFYLFNTHFDHQGEKARKESALLLLSQLDVIADNEPVIVTGDFNATPSSSVYETLTQTSDFQEGVTLLDTRKVSRNNPYGPNGTFTGFDINTSPSGPIDYIFVNGRVEVLSHATLSDTFNGRYPSDHMPVLAEVVLK